MYCKHCGKEIPNDAVFCCYCGKKLDDTPAGSEISASTLADYYRSYTEEQKNADEHIKWKNNTITYPEAKKTPEAYAAGTCG